MGYVLLAIGFLLAWLDYLGSGNVEEAISLSYQEIFAGNPPFWKWLGAVVIIGAIGYVPEMEPIATGMLALVLLAIVLSQGKGSDFTTLLKDV